MNKEEIFAIAEKYRNMSDKEKRYGESRCALFEQIADFIEDNYFEFEDNEDFESEEDIVNFAKESMNSFLNHFDKEDLENMDMID